MGHEPPPTYAEMRAALGTELADIAAAGSLRRRIAIDSRGGRSVVVHEHGKRHRLINWASNDYLGASAHLLVKNGAMRAMRRFGPGSGAARLLAGGLRCHRQLEERIARWLGREECLLTTTGYQANCAALVALACEVECVVLLDRLCHASLYDGTKLSNAQMLRFKHNDVDDLARRLEQTVGARRRIVCVESVYSMDGDEAPLAAIHALCRAHGALLLVDEAHALGVLGPHGRGLCAEVGIVPDLWIANCSKTLAAQGGLIAGDRDLIELIVNRGRAFIFSTAPVPAASGAAVGALNLIRNRPELQTQLADAAQEIRRGLQAQGWDVPPGRTPIIPVLIGDEAPTLALSAALRDLGHWAPAIRPPTVPPGQCRLRITVTAGHTAADRKRLLKACASLKTKHPGTPIS
ncbi:MAG: 8-amino-7-oxononanoate synthase [Planctomycetota bacterium]